MGVISRPLLRFTASPYKVNYNDDGSIDALFKLPAQMPNTEIPKIECLNDSIYLLKISYRFAKKIKKEITTESIIKTTGLIQAATNTKKVPLILVRPLLLTIDSKELKTAEQSPKMHMKKIWYLDKDLIEINVSDIIMSHPEHLNCKVLNIGGSFLYAKEKGAYNWPVAVRQLDNGKYELIAGVRSFVICKVMNVSKVKAHITPLSHEEFLKENIDTIFPNERNGVDKFD